MNTFEFLIGCMNILLCFKKAKSIMCRITIEITKNSKYSEHNVTKIGPQVP